MIDIHLPIVPPTTTSQMKRQVWTPKGPRFFKSTRQQQVEHTYLTLLQPFRPAAPMDGAVEMAVTFTWPHLAATPKRLRDRVLPKATRPDADNLVKALQDCLVRLQFVRDDGQIAALRLEKYHGPAESVGIWIRIAPIVETAAAPEPASLLSEGGANVRYS